nr:HexA [synthetic construct]
MEKNIFKLDNEQLKGIAHAFREKVEEGLNKNNAEIQCIPTFILPKATDVKGKALVLDLGGTNYRVAIVDFSTEKPIIYPNNGWKKDMSIMKSPGYTREELFKELADLIVEIKREEEMPIGYCFSYPTESIPGGDARLLRWTKGVDIREMVGQFVGKPLLDYLNEKNKIRFTGVKVLNDTIASLFAGLTDKSYDAYIGLIVGTGTKRPHYPDIHKDIYVQVAHWIYNRSAQLVAASLAGLIALLKSYNRDIHRVCLIAEGSLFWSESRKDKNYNILVMEKLQELLRELELEDVEVHINSMDNANLIGTGIAALS